MARYRKPIRSLAAGLAGFLLTLVAWAQDGSVVAGAPDQATRIEVKGVLIAPRSRSALINGRIRRVGDRIGDIEIVAIGEREIRLRTGDYESGISVGSSLSISRLNWSPVTPEPVKPQPARVATVPEVPADPVPADEMPQRHSVAPGETLSEIAPAPLQVASIPEVPAEPVLAGEKPQIHAVVPGETLSEIAETYLVPGVRRYQLMVALFEANPHAFNGNINRMRAGVVLDIPDAATLASLSPKTAMAKVMEQTDRWKNERPRKPEEVQPQAADTYGPVSSGETLSHIAHRLSPSGTDALELMSALYRANPHAFGNNMHQLRVGVVLSVPDELHYDRPPTDDGPVVAKVSTFRKSRAGHD